MRHAVSTHLFVNHHLTVALLDRLVKAGFHEVEIFCARQHLDYRNRAQVEELAHWFRDSELKLHSMHSPMFSDTIWGRSGPNAVVSITEAEKSRRRRGRRSRPRPRPRRA
jgi:sugar phosphate isomerase/epimerase